MNNKLTKEDKIEWKNKRLPLKFHKIIIFFMYAIAASISLFILTRSEANANLVIILSTGAILATFGSAISTISNSLQSDLLQRILINIGVLQKDIIKQPDAWRRWPFLPRFSKKRLLNNHEINLDLTNPELFLDVGTHQINIHIPTVQEDFYDLPLVRNLWQLFRFNKAIATLITTRPREYVNPKNTLKSSDEYMAYKCLYDVWKSILRFRISKYTMHFGSALTIFGAIISCIIIIQKYF